MLVRDDRQLDAYTYTIGLAGVILLLLPVVPGVGREINGARLWVDIGGLSFQPAEFGKILIVIFLASYLSAKRELLAAGVGRLGLPRVKDLGPLLLAWGASLAVLFLERDMGASLLFFGVFVVMVWVASGRPRLPRRRDSCCSRRGPASGTSRSPRAGRASTTGCTRSTRRRCTTIGYGQLAQGWFAIATGGLVGTGLGQGSPDADPLRRERLHPRGVRRGARDARRRPRSCCCTWS